MAGCLAQPRRRNSRRRVIKTVRQNCHAGGFRSGTAPDRQVHRAAAIRVWHSKIGLPDLRQRGLP